MNKAVTPRGWQARLDLEYGLRGSKTRLVNKRQVGPLALQRSFYPEGDICHNYVLHPPGGVVGGDSLRITVNAQPGAHCLLTTPGATKFYRSNGQLVGAQSQQITVQDDAIVEWLPQQNIFFPGANAALNTSIDIAPQGKFIGWEMHCLGRPANNEKFSSGALRSQTRVYIAGQLRLIEQLNTNADQILDCATGLRGLAMQGSFIAAPCNGAQRDAMEQILQSNTEGSYPHPIGLTLVDEVLVIRALGEQTEPMLEIFTRLWNELRQQWLQQAPCAPRIWAT